MKKLLLFVCCSAMLNNQVFSQTLTFSKTFGGIRLDDARSVVGCADGKIVFTGLTKSGTDSLGTMYLTCLNAAGAVVWSRQFDRLQEDGGNGLLQTRDGGFLISGHTALSYGSECDGYLLRTDADGQELWRAFVGKNLDDVVTSSIEMPDGSFVSVGRIEDAGSHTFRVLFARLDRNGNQILLKQLGSDAACLAYRVCQSADGNLLVSGFTDAQPNFPLLLKCTPDGELLWQIRFDERPNGRARQAIALPDGGCIAVGNQNDAQGGFEKMWLARIDAQGKIGQQRLLPENSDTKNGLFDAVLSADGNLVGCGLEISAMGEEKPFVARFNTELDLLEKRVCDEPGARFRSISIGPDGSLVLAGQVQTAQNGLDIYMARQAGFGAGAATAEASEVDFLLFPNPFSGKAYLKIGEAGQPKTLSLRAADGRLLRQTAFDSPDVFIESVGLPKGLLYFSVETQSGKTLKSGRLMLVQTD